MRRFLLLPCLLVLVVASVILSQSSVRNPHGALKWDCQDCHTTDSWSKIRSDLKFDHGETGFQLTGAHAAAQCIGCHKDPVFSHVSIACADCHADHHNGRLGSDCQNCHTPRDWQNRRDALELHSTRGFPLIGAHAVADCESCHRGHAQQEYTGTPVDCFSCHADEYAATSEPNHKLAAFSVDCQSCHSSSLASWRYAEFSHPASFPLAGAHRNLACAECHAAGYTGTPVDCYLCHSLDYASATDPNHEVSNFSHDCRQCHSTTAWQPATFDHASTAFPLTGAHRQAACIACHATQYAGTPSACLACHQAAYESTTDPSHIAAGFPTNCETCHSTSAWSPANWDHDALYFPIYSGAHRNEWTQCTDCHVNPASFVVFECTTCHEHNQTDMDNKHREEQGYQYLSSACYNCHPRGTH